MKKTLALLFIFLIGAFLRLILLQDIEYKYDEHYMYEQARSIGVTQPWPAVGMESGVRLRNPGMSMWIFAVLAKIFAVQSPPDLARAVQIMNVLAVGMVLLFGLRIVSPQERRIWFWAAALVAVNPLAVLLHRKIWAQSTLPLLCSLMWLGWFKRDKRSGAFFWGLLGACLGQIHMSGFFLAFAVFLWTLFFERKRKAPKKIEWRFWFCGSLIGALGLIPWLDYVLHSQVGRTAPLPWIELLHFRYWSNWITDGFGLGLSYSLGNREFLEFLKYPLLSGYPSGLMGLCHGVLIATLVLILASFLLSLRRGEWIHRILGLESDGAFARSAVFWGCGVFLTLSGAFIHRHYMIMTFPFEWLWLSQMAWARPARAKIILSIVVACNLILSVGFLHYIHVNHGAISGDYGVAYEFQ